MLLYIILRKDFRLRGKTDKQRKDFTRPQIKSTRKEEGGFSSVELV